jgi:hypothetical protein
MCRFWVSFEPDGRPMPLEQDRLMAHRDVRHPIPDRLDIGDLKLIAPSAIRPFASLSDDELETQVRAYWEIPDGISPFEPWHWLCMELARRPEKRWEALAEELLEPMQNRNGIEERDRRRAGELELLTALRRRQGRPDPIALEVRRWSRSWARCPRTTDSR